MTSSGEALARRSTRPPPWRDIRVLRVAFQFVVVAAVAALLWTLASNLVANLTRQGLRTDFGFLTGPAGFSIAGSSFRPSQSVREALTVGIVNTALVSVIGIVVATVIGLIVGIARLSTNVLVARAASFYVESLRNVPVLVIIIFWSTAVLLRLPRFDEASRWLRSAVVSNRGIWLPWFQTGAGARGLLVVAIAAAAGAVGAAILRTRSSERTGRPHHRVLTGLAAFAVPMAVAFVVLGFPVAVDAPRLTDGSVEGGIRLLPEYLAVLLGLSVYTASHIAEIVRASIQSVHSGQSEAANALGLSPAQRLRFVVLPQALRVMVPPLANQYLNLTKNSSLGVAVAYAEITSVTNIVIGNGNPAPQSIAILMGLYLVLSLAIAAATNLLNRRLEIATR